MGDRTLGRLKKVELRTVWKSEETGFTSWLALPENLEVLGDTLGLDLELQKQEKRVGRFRADILCKDKDTLVLIENQLARTDHTHLGQLLTYAAGLKAVTIVWLAKPPFRDEHRAALDWLNEITAEDFRFFGLEIELWKIGDSPAAPKFNIVSKPNDGSRSVRRSTQATEPSETQLEQKQYWTEFHKKLDALSGPIAGDLKPQPQSWMEYGIGQGGFKLWAVTNRFKGWVRVECHISGDDAKERFGLLERQQEEIERELGYSLEWEELPSGNDSRIARYLHDVNLEDKADWPRQHEWLARHLNDLHRVFSQRVKDL